MTTPTNPPTPTPRVETVEQAVKRIEDSFWRRYNASPDLQEKLRGKDRLIQLDVTNGEPWLFRIADGKMSEVRQGRDASAKVVLTLSKEDLCALFNRELNPMQAYLTKRVKVKASFGDILFAKSLLGW